jgi:hypothetical protein
MGRCELRSAHRALGGLGVKEFLLGGFLEGAKSGEKEIRANPCERGLRRLYCEGGRVNGPGCPVGFEACDSPSRMDT